MSANTPIEWTDHSFNIAWGCVRISPGCQKCYADALALRYGHSVWGPAKTTARRTFGAEHWAEPLKWNRVAEREGVRRRVFCSSMCDVFEDHPTIEAEREKLWPLIRRTPWLDWQLLTKRPERIAANLPADWEEFGPGYANVWLGTSIESQDYLERMAILGEVPAIVHFVSAEPLLGPLSLRSFLELIGVEEEWWVIVGGESGPEARPMELDWARGLRDECDEFGVRFFLKQLGGFPNKRGHELALLDGERHIDMPRGVCA